jgi:hypothetical protein
MTTIFQIVVGTACTVFIWKTYKKWREDRWAKRVLRPGAGLDRI